MISNPIHGIRYFFQGFKLLTKPGVKRFVIMPLLINVLLFGSLLWLGASQAEALMNSLMPQVPEWLQWLEWLVWTLFIVGMLLIVFFTFTLVANLIGAPFNGFLAEAVERHLTGRAPDTETTWGEMFKEVAVAIPLELNKLGYLISRAVPVLILFLIPLVNVFAPVLWLVFGAWMLALEYADYPMGNHSIRFPGVRQRLAEKRMMTLGFGSATMLATAIPVVNFFVMPAAVAGATLMWVNEFANEADAATRLTGTGGEEEI